MCATPKNFGLPFLYMKISGNSLRHFGATALISAVLAGCSAHLPPKPDEAKVKQFVGQGYLTDDHFAITTTYATWTAGSETYDVALTVPTKTGAFPLVIYLPALGEPRSAGEVWRTAWAQGGYAVLSLQPLTEDGGAWSSAKARAGDFASLARERYSAKAMAARLAVLQSAWQELSRRQARREVLLERIDMTRVAIAGYDLGAYTAMVVAGEHLRGLTLPALPMPVRAVIAMSPHADFSGTAFSTRYRAISTPVLSVTSDDDWDALGLGTTPSIRRAPFEYMPPGDKYLLTMSGLSHSELAGGALAASDEDLRPGGSHESEGLGRSPGGGHGGHHFGDQGGHGNAGGEARQGGQERSGSPAHARLSPTARAIGRAAIQGVSTAFLDVYVKRDAIAQEWLDKDARRWLGERGEFKKK